MSSVANGSLSRLLDEFCDMAVVSFDNVLAGLCDDTFQDSHLFYALDLDQLSFVLIGNHILRLLVDKSPFLGF